MVHYVARILAMMTTPSKISIELSGWIKMPSCMYIHISDAAIKASIVIRINSDMERATDIRAMR